MVKVHKVKESDWSDFFHNLQTLFLRMDSA